MKTIHKFPLAFNGPTPVALPDDAQVLSVAEQNEQVMVWVLFTKDAPRSLHRFRSHLTGEDIHRIRGEHIGTVLLDEGSFVTHVFYEGKIEDERV